MNHEPHLPGFTFLNEGALMKKSLFITVSICFALVLGTASKIHAQSVAGITGVAGFETGLQVIASVDLAHESVLGDLNPPGAVILWGDKTAENQGLLSCSGGESDPCDVYGSHWYTSPGTYTISITYNEPAGPCILFINCGPGPQHTLYTTATITAPWNDPGAYVIVSIGDSVASGEGNPNVPASHSHNNYGLWDDPNSDYDRKFYPADEQAVWPNYDPCHRSGWAGPALAAQEIQAGSPNVTFIHYACSGAKVAAADTSKTTAQDAINQLRIVRQRVPRIDALLITAGANSLNGPNSFGGGLGDLVKYCLESSIIPVHPCVNNSNVKQDIADSLTNLTKPGGSYEQLAQVINCINPADGTPEASCNHPQDQIPKMVLITEYMDPTHDQNGDYPPYTSGECTGPFSVLDASDWAFFHDSILDPLNQAVDSFQGIAYSVGLSAQVSTVTGMEQAFHTHGICAGNQHWVFDLHDSHNLLGAALGGTKDDGAMHPISARYIQELGLQVPADGKCCGQEVYRDGIYNTIVENSYPVTTASATAGGDAYTFGTWTNQDVVVTLSATNAIKQSGVKQTLYAVDDTADCQPVTWPRCSVYGGPFTIGTSGKHTVTFDSQNNAGIMWSFQNVQVWVDKNPALSSVPETMTIPQGESASYTISLGHFGWAGQTINLSCTTDAQLSQCTMLPTSVTLDATNSNTAVATVVTTRTGGLPGQAALVQHNPFGPLEALRFLLAFTMATFLVAMARALRAQRWVRVTNFAALALLFGWLSAGCNSAAQIPGTPRGAYTVTITGTSGMTTNTVQTKLVVK